MTVPTLSDLIAGAVQAHAELVSRAETDAAGGRAMIRKLLVSLFDPCPLVRRSNLDIAVYALQAAPYLGDQSPSICMECDGEGELPMTMLDNDGLASQICVACEGIGFVVDPFDDGECGE